METENQEKKNCLRDSYVDVAKGIAMLLVVSIHTEVFGVIHTPYPIIAVPLFFFLSGFYDRTSKPIREWLPKTFCQLIVTTLIWVLFLMLFHIVLASAKNGSLPNSISSLTSCFTFGAMWFLVALFYAKVGMWLIHISRLKYYIVIPILIMLGMLMSIVKLPLLLGEGIAALPFYYCGWICYPLIKEHKKHLAWLAVLGAVCILMMPLPWFPHVLVAYHSTLYLYPVCFLMTLLSFATILWISMKLANVRWLEKYGTQTLGILVIHPFLLHTCAITFNRVFTKGSTIWIAVFLLAYIAVCIICYYLTITINKHCPVLFGKIKLVQRKANRSE